MISRKHFRHRAPHEILSKPDAHHFTLNTPRRPVFSREELNPQVRIGIFVGQPICRQPNQKPGNLIVGGPALPQAADDLTLSTSPGHRKSQGGLPQAFERRDVLNLGNTGIVHLLPR